MRTSSSRDIRPHAERAAPVPEVRDTGRALRLTWRGRTALAILTVHLALLLLPFLPYVPYVPSFRPEALPAYVLAGAIVLFAVLEAERAALELRTWWRTLDRSRRLLFSYGATAALLAIGGLLLALAPAVLARLSLEQGLLEPLSLFLYIAAAMLLVKSARGAGGTDRGSAPQWLAASFFALATAEELDYLGAFSPFIGRVEGLYLGTPHDLLRYWAEGVAPPAMAAILALPALAVLVVLWRYGHLRASALHVLARPLPIGWAVSAAALIGLALAEEAHVLHLTMGGTSPEELLETGAAVLLAALALDVAAAAEADGSDPHASTREAEATD